MSTVLPQISNNITQSNDKNDHNEISVPSTANDEEIDDEMDEEWKKQLEAVKEYEYWEKGFIKIPIDLQQQYKDLFSNYSTDRRIMIYKLLNVFDFNEEICNHLYNTLLKCINSRIEWLLSLIYHHHDNKNNIDIVFKLINEFTKSLLDELVLDISMDQFNHIIDILRFLNESERNEFLQFCYELSIKQMLSFIDHFSHQLVQHCPLCRYKRLERLENHMLCGDIPKNVIKVAGNVLYIDYEGYL